MINRTHNRSTSSAVRLVLSCVSGLIALLAVFLLHSVTTLLRTSAIWSFVLMICMTGLLIVIGVAVRKLSGDVTLAYVLVAMIVLTCELSWYWWDYRDFQSRVAQTSVAAQMADSSTLADTFLMTEVGSPGFWGYLKWSAAQGATFDEAPIPAGTKATIVNWGKRLISLFWALVWAFVGFVNS